MPNSSIVAVGGGCAFDFTVSRFVSSHSCQAGTTHLIVISNTGAFSPAAGSATRVTNIFDVDQAAG